MWNCSVYTKSIWDDAWLSCIGSSAIPCSPSYKTGGLSYFRQLQRFPDIPVSNREEHQFQHRNSRKAPWTPYHLEKRADSQDFIEEVGQLSQAPQEYPSLSNSYVRGSLILLPQIEWILRSPDSKEGRFPCSGLNAGSSFIAQDKAMYESLVENLEKDLSARLIWTGSSHPLTLREACGIQWFKRWWCLILHENG